MRVCNCVGGNKIEIYNSVERVGFIEKVIFEPRFEAGKEFTSQILGKTLSYRQRKSPKIRGLFLKKFIFVALAHWILASTW